MPHQAVEPKAQASAARDERDPQKITDLIEQLDHDLVETQKNTSKRH